MNRKQMITILATLMISVTLIAPMLNSPVSASDPPEWYRTVNGVLYTDYYSLYPYAARSLDVGFSKFGEMISYDQTADIGVGLQYPGYDEVATYDQRLGTSRDAFADEGIERKYWLQGWFIEIEYTHRTLSDRFVWAMAMFADMMSFEGDWLTAHPWPPESPPYGGRKTNTYAVTEEMKILYHGPRRFVALLNTTIYDWDDTNGNGVIDLEPEAEKEVWEVVRVMITVIFNKVKKEVILLKDIKLVIDKKVLDSPVDVQFSNRGEWDLGPEGDWTSYAHFYHQNLTTCYGPEWHLTPAIMRAYWYEEIAFGGQTTVQLPQDNIEEFPYYCFPVVERSERVYINDDPATEPELEGFQKPGIDYNIDYLTGLITFTHPLESTDKIKVKYKLYKCDCIEWIVQGEEFELLGIPHLYDLAQVISSDVAYVGFAAFWPVLSDYTVDGWGRHFRTLINVDDEDMLPYSTEPDIPFVIGEWDFMLDLDEPTPWPIQFRGVTVYGLTDWHDALDEHMWVPVPGPPAPAWALNIDREVMFQLDEVFNPWDLRDAVTKETKRWVEWKPYGPTTFTTDTANTPVVVVADELWDQYSTFSEKVIRLDTGALLHRRAGDPVAGGLKDYWIVLNDDGTATLTGLPRAECKILYSTREEAGAGDAGLIQVGLCLDGSSSIIASEWAIITAGVAEAVRNSLPHDGSVELTVVQFGIPSPVWAQLEVAPTVITSDAVAEAIATVIEAMVQGNDLTPMAHGLNLTWFAMKNSLNFDPLQTQIINVATDGMPNIDLQGNYNWTTAPIDVTWVRNLAATEGLDEIDAEGIAVTPANLEWMRVGLVWPQPGTIAPPYTPGWVELVADAAAFAAAMATKFEIIIPPVRGRYEWGIVGRDAASVDAAGLGMVTEAFDSIKDIEVLKTGLDMQDTIWGPEVPYVMSWLRDDVDPEDDMVEVRPGVFQPSRAHYRDDIFGPCHGRSALRDDWCHTIPVASSNIITIGSPWANHLTEYFNEFTDAYLDVGTGPTDRPESMYPGYIVALTCWAKNTYMPTFDAEGGQVLGYAVIATYKDINGTVGFIIWGWTGQDTFFACEWFWDEGIEQLQKPEFEHVTSIILEIDYRRHPPLIDPIPEVLGTISERQIVHDQKTKGGIHDC